jgi:hypothetical protein
MRSVEEQELDRSSRVNPGGNERLTAAVGLLVLAPVLVEVSTILLGVHTFMSLHVFVGLALIPAVLLKLGSTGWRFARYYTRNGAYVEQGPPQIAMRLLAPLFVTATIVLFGSGVAMGLLHGHALQIARRLHGPASVIWLLLLGLHVVVYLGRAVSSTARDALPAKRRPLRGTTWRAYAVAAIVICGLVLGAATVPAQHRWVDLPRHRHDHRSGAPRSVESTRRRFGAIAPVRTTRTCTPESGHAENEPAAERARVILRDARRRRCNPDRVR